MKLWNKSIITVILVAALTHRIKQQIIEFRSTAFKMNVLFCPSLSLIIVHTLAHKLLSSHKGKYPLSVWKMEWNRWHQNDWNHLQWFLQLPYISPFLSPCSYPTTPIVWMHHPSLFNAIQAHSSCQRGPGSLEAPRCYTKSAKRRKRGGRRRKVDERGVFTTNLEFYTYFSCIIF